MDFSLYWKFAVPLFFFWRGGGGGALGRHLASQTIAGRMIVNEVDRVVVTFLFSVNIEVISGPLGLAIFLPWYRSSPNMTESETGSPITVTRRLHTYLNINCWLLSKRYVFQLLVVWFKFDIWKCLCACSLGGGGGGGEAKVSCPNIFPIACTKIKWFCPNITWFLPENCYFKNCRGAAAMLIMIILLFYYVHLWVCVYEYVHQLRVVRLEENNSRKTHSWLNSPSTLQRFSTKMEAIYDVPSDNLYLFVLRCDGRSRICFHIILENADWCSIEDFVGYIMREHNWLDRNKSQLFLFVIPTYPLD